MAFNVFSTPEDNPPGYDWLTRGRVRDLVEEYVEKSDSDEALDPDYARRLLYEDLAPREGVSSETVEEFIAAVDGWKHSSAPSEDTWLVESAFIEVCDMNASPRGAEGAVDVSDEMAAVASMCVLISQEVVRALHGEKMKIYRSQKSYSSRSMAFGFLLDPSPDEFSYTDNPLINFGLDLDKMGAFNGRTQINKTVSFKDLAFAPDIALPVGANKDESEVHLIGGKTTLDPRNVYTTTGKQFSDYFENGTLALHEERFAKEISNLSGAAAHMSRYDEMTTEFVYRLMDLQMQNYQYREAYDGYIKKALRQWDNPEDIETYRRLVDEYEDHLEFMEVEHGFTLDSEVVGSLGDESDEEPEPDDEEATADILSGL